ncbi:MAG: threonine synthase [Bacteroidota bacterium]|nr:threonine synthase [Bacteroidota bacterium]
MHLLGLKSNQIYNLLTTDWHGINFEPFEIIFKPAFDLAKISSRPCNLWRYREAIPIEKNAELITFNEGFTPLLSIGLGANLTILVKQEQLFSTGSYKDRGATVLTSHMKQLGISHLVQDSSGNAGAAIAAYAAKANIKCDIFLPEETSQAKLIQMAAYGANIVKIPGTRQDAALAAFEAAKNTYYASHSFNPFFIQGTKTFAYEVCEQLHWKSPDSVVLPAGNGTLVLGCFLGFNELAQAGIISKIPKIIAVQAKNCNPLAQAFHNGLKEVQKIEAQPTLAEGIAITHPIKGPQIIEAVLKTKGTFISVSEAEISSAWLQMAQKGFFIEPTSAAAIAGVTEYVKGLEKEEKIVTLFSGHGLKSLDKIEKILKVI